MSRAKMLHKCLMIIYMSIDLTSHKLTHDLEHFSRRHPCQNRRKSNTQCTEFSRLIPKISGITFRWHLRESSLVQLIIKLPTDQDPCENHQGRQLGKHHYPDKHESREDLEPSIHRHHPRSPLNFHFHFTPLTMMYWNYQSALVEIWVATESNSLFTIFCASMIYFWLTFSSTIGAERESLAKISLRVVLNVVNHNVFFVDLSQLFECRNTSSLRLF